MKGQLTHDTVQEFTKIPIQNIDDLKEKGYTSFSTVLDVKNPSDVGIIFSMFNDGKKKRMDIAVGAWVRSLVYVMVRR